MLLLLSPWNPIGQPQPYRYQRCFVLLIGVVEIERRAWEEAKEERRKARAKEEARVRRVAAKKRTARRLYQCDFFEFEEEEDEEAATPHTGGQRKWTADPRPRTIRNRDLTPTEVRGRRRLAVYYGQRPKTRGECEGGQRPCPFVTCQYHLYLDVNYNQPTASVRLNFPHLDVLDMKESCALDVADRGGITLEELGANLNISLEGARQAEKDTLDELRAKLGEGAMGAIVDMVRSRR